jgi:hypothetical protein
MHPRSSGCAMMVISVLCGCDSEQQNPVQAVMTQPNVTLHVTGNALAHIDGTGRFVLEDPRGPDGIPIISPERAKELAAAFLRTWGESHSGVWEHQRGAPLSTGSMRVAPRVYFAATPHSRFPDGYHPAYQRMFGPQYLVFFTSGEVPVLGLAISAYSTDLEIRNGLVHQPLEGGSYFMSRAVSASPPASYVPMRTGWHPLLALWRVRLDRPVNILPHDPTTPRIPPGPVRELFVGPGKSLFVPSVRQDASVRSYALRRGSTQGPAVAVDLPRREEMPVSFEEVTLLHQED